MNPFAPGATIDTYRLDHQLGEGGMGTVYRATQDSYVYRVKDDGSELQKVITTPLFPLAVSPDGQWIAVQDPQPGAP